MNEEEHQRLVRALEAQLEADLELIRAGYRAKRHALDMLRHPATQGEMQQEARHEDATRPDGYVLSGPLDQEIETRLPLLPDIFDRGDVLRILPFEVHRATLHRALETLLYTKKKIAVHTAGRGRQPTRYRKVGSP